MRLRFIHFHAPRFLYTRWNIPLDGQQHPRWLNFFVSLTFGTSRCWTIVTGKFYALNFFFLFLLLQIGSSPRSTGPGMGSRSGRGHQHHHHHHQQPLPEAAGGGQQPQDLMMNSPQHQHHQRSAGRGGGGRLPVGSKSPSASSQQSDPIYPLDAGMEPYSTLSGTWILFKSYVISFYKKKTYFEK